MRANKPLHPQKQKLSSPNGGKPGYFILPKSACIWFSCGFVSLALLHLFCCSSSGAREAVFSPLLQPGGGKSCNYSEGRWVWAPGHARRYNATECNVKWSHNCIRNGRHDTGYLDWRWQPEGCRLPAFDAKRFLSAMRGKHVAFVGDSMARNQVQSLICLLSAAFPPRIVYRDPEPWKCYFWRWAFPTHDVTVSFYWAPFIARATGKAVNESMAQNMNYVYLDALDDRWAADADTMDVVVLTAGHWFLNGAIYYNGSRVIGHHVHDELNASDIIGYAWPMQLAYRMALDRLSSGRPRTVMLATFSPPHFEGRTLTTGCPRKGPYEEGEKELRPVEKELRSLMYEEAEAATRRSGTTRVEVLDVTKLAFMRPDGHPGAYTHGDPSASGVHKWMLADCLHFCLPGPVDTFNEILQQLLTKSQGEVR
ncbi:xyloglucan O-acetyltransferase 1-like isoform X2 [Phragmites australis]|uniref:xyloglucan O-acetyltransferase 1-like isoform X2 n=1 Tax=Phragmites australis TaxID=29695 RepID=UPI002D770F80|nr:xyloglucan O-acetyltransferase 1-like isoform X2 [Phragmites australis]